MNEKKSTHINVTDKMIKPLPIDSQTQAIDCIVPYTNTVKLGL